MMIQLQPHSSKADILVVDDTPVNLRLLSNLLSEQGYEVRKAINGQMALTAVSTAPPDLILLDINMPDLTGYEVCTQLKNNQKTAQIPVIFLSALSDVNDKVKGFTVGGSDYITKPFEYEEIVLRVNNQLALKTAEEQLWRLNAQLEQRVRQRTQQLETANAQLQQIAFHDTLTGLPNRIQFRQQLDTALTQPTPDGQLAVLFIDCDRFKVVNDSLGHLVGDELLIALSQRINQSLQPHEILARLGGDEFALLLPQVRGAKEAVQTAEKILGILSQPFKLNQYEVFINASIGIALSCLDHKDSEHLLRDADTALYQAKANGRGCYHIFDRTLHLAVVNALELESELHRAVDQQQLVVHYQPILSLTTGTIEGFEALVRWYHPTRGLISPESFIPIAEETGLMTQISHWVLKQACHQLRVWQQQGELHDSVFVSVNLSTQQFAQLDLVEQIEQVLKETHIHPRCLKLEITENAIMDNPTTAAEILQQLQQRQIQLGIDDFGTGYSSLSYLHSFPVDTLKIDRSFIEHLDGTPENVKLVSVILGIAQTMNMSVIAEGIETQQQLVQLRSLDCNLGQGYYFSEPLPPEKAIKLATEQSKWLDLIHE
ncbi:MAG: EAL domain-containing protein [Microcoleaceae cyanobacterium]